MLSLIEYEDVEEGKKIIECNKTKNDIIFMKYNVCENDIIKLHENQYIIMCENGKILDVKEKIGNYIIKQTDNTSLTIDEEWKNLIIRDSEEQALCVIFINLNTIINNKYIISDPIQYIDWKNERASKIYIKLEGDYNFKIENPKMLLSKVIGLRACFTRQELIEKIRKYVLKNIELGINEVSEEYKLNIDELVNNSNKLEIKLKQNEYDMKLLQYGVKLTYFDIKKFEIVNKKNKFF